MDLDTDSLFSIDETSGSATLIGPLGFDIIGGGQGLDFDPDDDEATNLEEFEMGRNMIVNEGAVLTIINAIL